MDRSRLGESPFQTLTTRETDIAGLPPRARGDRRLDVNVIYTTRFGTLAALKIASRLGAHLGVRPKVLMLYAVPYTLPLEKPAVPIGFLEKQIQALTAESPTEITARIYLCRDPHRSLRQILPPRSLIVVGGRRRWWPTEEQRLARMLRKEGHQVIFVDPEEPEKEVPAECQVVDPSMLGIGQSSGH